LPSKGKLKNLGRLFSRRAENKTEPESELAPGAIQEEINRVPGAEFSAKLDPWWWLVVGVAVLIALMMALKPDPYWKIFLFVRDGMWITVQLTLISFVLIIIIGMIGGLGRIAKNPVIHIIATLYVEIVRGIPLLVQLIWWYFAAPVVVKSIGSGIHFSAMAHYRSNAFVLAIVGLSVCYGAYMAEIFRAGIQSIHKGQMEAARSLGMTYFQAMRYVIMPQAFRVVLPPVGNEFIMLIKDTSLVSAVAMADMTRRGREYMAAHLNPIETWTLVALLYLILTLFAARIIAWLESRAKY
jgi:polar amino acid transport system permease protein